jgi:hypothetical protein
LEPDQIKSTLNYEQKEPIFWRVFKELSDKGNELVEHDKLQERLISTGKFYASEAFMMIEHMEKIGKIEQTGGSYHVYTMAAPKS